MAIAAQRLPTGREILKVRIGFSPFLDSLTIKYWPRFTSSQRMIFVDLMHKCYGSIRGAAMEKQGSPETLSPRQVEAFKAVIEKGSVTAAAMAMHVSQPSVSRLLRSLEDSVGFPLFAREKGRLLATPEAMLFYEEIQRYFRNFQRLAHTAADIRALARGNLRIGTFVALTLAVTPTVVKAFREVNPDMNISCTTAQSRQIVDLVASRFADLGIVDPVAVSSEVHVERRWQFRCVCAMPAGHPLARSEIIPAEQLAGETVIGLEREFLGRHPPGAALYRRLAPKLRIQVQQSIAACALVAEGVGVAIVDPFTALYCRPTGIEVRPLAVSITFAISMLSYPAAPLSMAARQFLEMFEAELGRAGERAGHIVASG